ncbi:MAG: FAD-binding protein [Thermodesulfobacteriota bacterium]
MTKGAPAPKNWDYETDVIVIGAGTAGFPAAMMAAEAGAKVAIVELLPQAAPSLGLINVGPAFAGTDVQKEQGIDDSPEQYYIDGVELAKGDPELWKTFTDNQLDTYYWCQKIGMGFGKDLFPPPGHTRKRGIWMKGPDMVRCLEKNAKATKDVDLKYSHRAIRLITNPDTGRVLGLVVKVKDTEQNFKANRAVVIASGGFGRNKEMVEEYGPYFKDWMPTMCHGHLGDGLKMALDVGAATKHIGRAVSGSFAVDVESKTGIMDFIGYGGGIFVNVNGKRFDDESGRTRFYGLVTEEGMKQPGRVWFGIIDEKIKNTTLRAHMLKKAKLSRFDTLDDLAKTMGIDANGLKETLKKYNSDMETLGYDSVFDRRTQEGCEGKPLKIDTPPFYAVKCTGATSSFKGGLRINGKTQVLTQYGEIIPGLYAAGEVTGGMWGYGGTYLPCTLVSSGLTMGRVAGKAAANERPW